MKNYWALLKKLICFQDVGLHGQNHEQISSQQTHLRWLLLPRMSSKEKQSKSYLLIHWRYQFLTINKQFFSYKSNLSAMYSYGICPRIEENNYIACFENYYSPQTNLKWIDPHSLHIFQIIYLKNSEILVTSGFIWSSKTWSRACKIYLLTYNARFSLIIESCQTSTNRIFFKCACGY